MLLDRNKYTESGYIGEELIGDAMKQLEQRCMAVQQSVKDNDYAYDTALEVFQVTDAQYKTFIGEALNRNIFISFSGTTNPLNQADYLAIYENMLLSFFSKSSPRLKKIVRELELMSAEATPKA
jgi:hypothetical protein